MKTKEKVMLKVTNLAMTFERGGVCIPFGESTIDAQDWDIFLSSATDEVVLLPLRTGAIRVERIEELPNTLNTLSSAEIRAVLARVKDKETLKKLLWEAHADQKFWRARLLIRERMSLLGLNPSWSEDELFELDLRCPWRLADSYRSMTDINRPDPTPDNSAEIRMKKDLEKAELCRKAFQEYLKKKAEIEAI